MVRDLLGYLRGVVTHPRVTFEKLARQPSLRPAAVMVLGYGAYAGLMFSISYQSGDWPPPPAELKVWIEAWGEFSQLPFLKIRAEQYRLFLAIIMLPLVLAVWMLMAGTARLLGVLFGGRASFEQYLNLFAFSFFTFWLLASLLDASYNLVLGSRIVPALQGAYGPLASLLARYFPPMFYLILFGLAGVYNGIATHVAERLAGVYYAPWKSALVGIFTFAWPIVLVSVLIR